MRVPCNNLCACRIARTTEPKEAAKVARWDHRWSQPQPAHRVGKELAVDPSRHGEVITPPPGLRGAIVLGVVAQHNVRPRESHFMRAVTALRELDMHTGANYVHTKPEEDAAETWREEDGAYYYNPGSNKVRAAPHQPRAAARRAAPAEQQAPRSII